MTAGYPYPTVGVKPSMPLHYLSVGQIVGEAFEKCRREAERAGEAITTLKAAELLASTPMCFEPGEGLLYGHCSDILGAVVSVISGKSLSDSFVKKSPGRWGWWTLGICSPRSSVPAWRPHL